MRDFYDELEVAPGATSETIHAAFSSLTERVTSGGGAADPARMERLVAAYRVLSNPQRRATYDAERGSDGRPELVPPSPGLATIPAPPIITPDRSGPTDAAIDDFLSRPIVRLIIQKNVEGFQKKWTALSERRRTLGRKGAVSWNWWAFLFGPFYLCYRKMYLYAAAWTAACFVIGLIENGLHITAASYFYVGLSTSFAMSTNSFYFDHVRKLAADIESRHADSASQLAIATAKGGTSWLAGIFGGLMCLLAGSIPDFFAALPLSGS